MRPTPSNGYRRAFLSVAIVTALFLGVSACADGKAASSEPTTTFSVALAVTTTTGAADAANDRTPLDGELLTPGDTYRVTNRFGPIGLRFMAPESTAYIGMPRGSTGLFATADFQGGELVSVWPVTGTRVFTMPFVDLEQLASPGDVNRVLSPFPDDFLSWLASSPLVEVVEAQHGVTYGEAVGQELTMKVRSRPAEATLNGTCPSGCAYLWLNTDVADGLEFRPELWRVAVVEVGGQHLIIEWYDTPAAREVLASLTFLVQPNSDSNSLPGS
jgi:hypothetical protein